MKGWLGVKPPIPVLNRWNKIYYPAAWWNMGIEFFAIVAQAFLLVKMRTAGQLDEDGLHTVDAMGLLGSQFFKVLKAVRWKRGATFVNGEVQNRRLPLVATLMKPLLHFMGSTFLAARSGTWGMYVTFFTSTETLPSGRFWLCMIS